MLFLERRSPFFTNVWYDNKPIGSCMLEYNHHQQKVLKMCFGEIEETKLMPPDTTTTSNIIKSFINENPVILLDKDYMKSIQNKKYISED